MIRVAHVITELSVGGAETMLSRLVQGMDATKFSQVVISLSDPGPIGQELQKLGFRVETLGMRPGHPSPSAIWKLVRLLRAFRPHVLQSWLYHADLAGLLASGLSGRPRLIWNLRCSDMDLSHYSKVTALVVKSCVRFSGIPDAVIVNSDAGRRYHSSIGYHPRRWETIPNGFDLERFRPDPTSRVRLRTELELPADTLLVGLVARFDPMKDHETFLRAAAEVHRKHSGVHFVLCGTGVVDGSGPLSGWADSLGLGSVVHLLGERRDIHLVTGALDVATSSSRWGEGFPNVVGEAMSCGVPCVVTDVGDSALLLGNAGIVVPARQPGAFASALVDLIESSPEGRRELGALGRRRIEKDYGLVAIVGRYERFFEEILSACAG